MFKDSICLDGVLERHSVDGVKFAMVEWLLLSRSDLILHTYGSSFAMEAGYSFLVLIQFFL